MVRRNWLLGLASLGLLLGTQTPGTANPKQAQQAAQQAAKQQQKANQTQVHATLLNELHAIHNTLVQAKHDYDGHRASAVGHVHKAMHELHQEMAHFNKQAAQQLKVPKVTEPTAQALKQEGQAASDAALQQSVTNLKTVHQQVVTLSQGPHHGQVVHHLNKAIHELHTALKIK
jgi:hypothetical protein